MKQQNWTGKLQAGQQSSQGGNQAWMESGLIAGGAIATILTFTPLTLAGPLTQWKFDPQANRLELTVKTDAPPRYFMMAQPARIVVDLPNTQIKNVETQQTYGGVVRQIRVSQFKPDQTRIVIELSPDAVLAPGQVKVERAGKQWIVSPLIVPTSAPVAKVVPPSPAESAQVAVPSIALPTNADPANLMPASVAPSGNLESAQIAVPSIALPTNADPANLMPAPSVAPSNNTDPVAVLPVPPAISSDLPGTFTGSTPTPPEAAATPAMAGVTDTTLPPANFIPPASSPTVSVPPLAAPASIAKTEPVPTTPFIVMPSSTATTPLSMPVAVPVGQPSPAAVAPPALPAPQPQSEQPPTVGMPLPSGAVTAQASPPTPAPAAQPSVAVIQPETGSKQDAAPIPTVRIPILEFGQPLPKTALELPPASAAQPATQLPPLEPGAIVLPVEGPGGLPR